MKTNTKVSKVRPTSEASRTKLSLLVVCGLLQPYNGGYYRWRN